MRTFLCQNITPDSIENINKQGTLQKTDNIDFVGIGYY